MATTLNFNLPAWGITEMTGYVPKTTFWQDFSIADRFGVSAINDTYRRAFKEWRSNVVYLTELVMVLNHKIWWYYEAYQKTGNKAFDTIARIYDGLWRKADEWCAKHLKGADAEYYHSTTD